jgi:hypothetical protein
VKKTAIALALGLFLAPPLWADEGPTDKEPAKGNGEAAGTDEGPKKQDIEFVKDFEEGQAKAKEAKKGLFVYLTPSWFT